MPNWQNCLFVDRNMLSFVGCTWLTPSVGSSKTAKHHVLGAYTPVVADKLDYFGRS